MYIFHSAGTLTKGNVKSFFVAVASTTTRNGGVLLNGKSLERAGSVTEEVVLCSGLVDDGLDHRRYMKPRFIIVSSYPTSWAYSRNIRSH